MTTVSKQTIYAQLLFIVTANTQLRTELLGILPNQELSGAKSELQGGTVGVCSSYKRAAQPPNKYALRSMQMCLLMHIYKMKHLRIKNMKRKLI